MQDSIMEDNLKMESSKIYLNEDNVTKNEKNMWFVKIAEVC